MNDYNRLPTSTKFIKAIAGLVPPLVVWQQVQNVWYAIGVYAFGIVAGNFLSSRHLQFIARSAERDSGGRILADEYDHVLKKSLPIFLWAPALCGVAAGLLVIAMKAN